LGGDPSSILSSGAGSGSPRTEQRELTAEDKKIGEMVDMMGKWNITTWDQVFQENGMQYTPPKIILFSETTQSGCGVAQSAMGPFTVLQISLFIWT
jgi:predicted metalloprotease